MAENAFGILSTRYDKPIPIKVRRYYPRFAVTDDPIKTETEPTVQHNKDTSELNRRIVNTNIKRKQ